MWASLLVYKLLSMGNADGLVGVRKAKVKEAMDRFEIRNNGHKRMSEVDSDYVNLDPWMNG